ncbi:LEA type 2 family protein, partial [Candidatus Sumerlaeota bacterium]|nr:LEA type 2 family protein [Candidatus Sumerlaeota bacterium]
VDYTVNGALVLPVMGRKFELPLSHTGKFPVLQLPKVSIVKMNSPEISLTKALVSFDAQIENPNVFEIGLGNLGYSLNLGDVKLGDLVAATGGRIGSGQSGRLTLKGELSAVDAVRQLAGGSGLGGAKIMPTGTIQTPYGAIKMPDWINAK